MEYTVIVPRPVNPRLNERRSLPRFEPVTVVAGG